MGVPVVVEGWVSLRSLPPKEVMVALVVKAILAVGGRGVGWVVAVWIGLD